MGALDRYTCEEMLRKLDAYLDRRLNPDELKHVEEHLETCARCATEYRFERSLLDGIGEKLRRAAVPSDLMQKISRLLEKEGESHDKK